MLSTDPSPPSEIFFLPRLPIAPDSWRGAKSLTILIAATRLSGPTLARLDGYSHYTIVLAPGLLAPALRLFRPVEDLTIPLSLLDVAAEKALGTLQTRRLVLVCAKNTARRVAPRIPPLPPSVIELVLRGEGGAVWVTGVQLPDLVSVAISGVHVNASFFDALPTTLARLSIDAPAFTAKAVEGLVARLARKLRKLEVLRIVCMLNTDVSAELLQRLVDALPETCVTLDLGAACRNAEHHSWCLAQRPLELVSAPPHLESLSLGPCIVFKDESPLPPLEAFPNLASLRLFSTHDLFWMDRLPRDLLHLTIPDLQDSSRLSPALAASTPILRSLSVPSSSLLKPQMRTYIAALPGLERLSIRGNRYPAPASFAPHQDPHAPGIRDCTHLTDPILATLPPSLIMIDIDGLHGCSQAAITDLRTQGVHVVLASESDEYKTMLLALSGPNRVPREDAVEFDRLSRALFFNPDGREGMIVWCMAALGRQFNDECPPPPTYASVWTRQ
ncbi:hypothetical protein BDK51DRAFT_43483 [Blyttiomyces helicus]|uniref:F-box domain-containing protein n=1 Tax=Blyttiomyces helicus TaxID=388810 RepID=A0A4V1IR56_9FUNG|nr:hypothetical protein BDK51DRAFT_43483 [Blyttiomyces helicus]|eukprot:RKO88887.1 hypothetical protein BDK51DRAFT_43483 [Blyttiomyces helicus]